MTQEDHDSTSATPAHDSGTGKGEEKGSGMGGGEAGRHDEGESHADRPAGGSTARDHTSINPEDRDPIDPAMPNYPQE